MTRPTAPISHRLARAAIAAGALLLADCATVPPDAGKNPRDPYEGFNRNVYAFNDKLDRYALRPVAKGYVAVVPHAFRLCISNAFSNVAEIRNAVNDILQAKPIGASTDTGRLVINTTLGMFGCFDVATKMGLEGRHEDFGLTLARWGAGTGPYLVLPILGPSDVRDGIGVVPDLYTNPVSYVHPIYDRYIYNVFAVIDTRANLLDATDLIDRTALDRYQFTRDAYLQRRRSLEYEGNPPLAPEGDEGDETGSRPGGTEPKPGSRPSGTEAKPAQPAPGDRR